VRFVCGGLLARILHRKGLDIMNGIAPLLRKKWLLAVIAAAVVGSGAYAFAATLTTTSGTLGAGNTTVTSCTSDSARATYTTAYDANLTAGHFAVATVTLTFGVGTTCTTGDKLEVVLTGASNAAVGSFVYTVGSGDTLASNAVTATAASSTPSGAGVGLTNGGTLATGPDGTSFIGATAATTLSTALSAQSVTGVAVSAVGA
jgi:hypothetical protein